MNKELQDRSWACLPKETRDEVIRCFKYASKNSKSDLQRGAADTFEHLFGSHNLTSDTEPEEMLMVERKKVIKDYIQYDKREDDFAFDYANKSVCIELYTLFGDKCRPDNTESVQREPKFREGDKVIVIDNIRAVYPDPMTIKGVSLVGDGKYCYNVIEYGIKFHEDNLELYTESETN